MDHPIAKLDECIFDYLVSHANQMKSIDEIFYDISGTSGHRCSKLISTPNARQIFTTKCYTLDRHFKNVRKLFRGDQLYLIFDQDRRFDNIDYDESVFKDVPINPTYSWDIGSTSVIDYMFSDMHYNDYTGSYFTTRFDGVDTILHILVRNNGTDRLADLLEHYSLDIECKNWKGQTPFELAVDLRNVTAASMLCKYKYALIINKLQAELSKERALREEYQKTIDTTGKHFNLMSKLEATPQPQKIMYIDTPLSTYNKYSLRLGYMVQFAMAMLVLSKIFL